MSEENPTSEKRESPAAETTTSPKPETQEEPSTTTTTADSKPDAQHQRPSQSTSPRASSQNPGSKPAERPRLSESEKKSNHIASEQKRRMAIREGFDRLTELVPGLEGMGRSESVVLQKTVEYIRKNLEEEQELRRRVIELGGTLPDEGIRQ